MKNLIKFKSLVCIILSIAIIIVYVPLCATTTPLPPHTAIVNQYINEIRGTQTQILNLLQTALENPPTDRGAIIRNINFFNSRVLDLISSVTAYSDSLPPLSSENRDLLVLLSALNFMRTSLYELSVLINITNNLERALILERFFISRINANSALTVVQNIIQST